MRVDPIHMRLIKLIKSRGTHALWSLCSVPGDINFLDNWPILVVHLVRVLVVCMPIISHIILRLTADFHLGKVVHLAPDTITCRIEHFQRLRVLHSLLL